MSEKLKLINVSDQESEIVGVQISAEVVLKKPTLLKPNTAAGIDNINTSLLIKLADSIKEPLCILFNRSLDTGVVPDDWKRLMLYPFLIGAKR